MNYQVIGKSLGIPVEVAEKELSAIHEKFGSLTTHNVLQCARSPESPLHDYFVWDDTEAAEKYRLMQAGQLIRSIRVRISKAAPPVRRFVNVRRDEEGELSINPFENSNNEYKPVEEAMKSPLIKEHLFEKALYEIECFERKYSHMKEFAGIFNELRKLKKKRKRPRRDDDRPRGIA